MQKFISWNVNGIRAVYKKDFLAFVKQADPDVIAIQETKAHFDQLPDELINVPGYFSYFSSGERKGYSGVAVYTKEKPLKVEDGFGDNLFNKEGRILILTYSTYKFINIYYPNGKSGDIRLKYKLDFYQAFLNYVQSNSDIPLVICGDVNTAHKGIDLARPKENQKISGFLPKERAYIDNFLDAGLIDTFREFDKSPEKYTWWDQKSHARERNKGWRIDYFFVSKSLRNKLKSAYILKDVLGSDHCPIGIDIDL